MNDPASCTALVPYTASLDDSTAANEDTVATQAIPVSWTSNAARTKAASRPGMDDAGAANGSTAPAAARAPSPRFVGLSNQGATCYMNSLLQTLYMTPEFRSALYEWQYEPNTGQEGVAGVGQALGRSQYAAGTDGEAAAEDPSDCIPLQLQRLFGQLQLSGRTCVETRALTDSFGWTAQDSFQQHDVQELCRVLFDALESTFQGTVNEKLVNNLYQGSLRDYVTCKECHSESSRLDNFLDISLVLRPFGSDKTMKSVTESLEYFLKPEVLDGENQYCCQSCDKKVDAVKGLKFERLPYLLSLQLKRFDFDYNTFQRIKLNDEMRFPLVLDMNKYVDHPVQGQEGDASGFGGKQGGHQRSDFQRSMSLERKQLQGLSGKFVEDDDASDGDAEPGAAKKIANEKAVGGSGSGDDSNGESHAIAGSGGDRVAPDAAPATGVGVAATAVGPGGAAAAGSATADVDTDETDKEEGSMDSDGSADARRDDVDLPELEDYWGVPFRAKAANGGRKAGDFGSIGDHPRGGGGGRGGSEGGTASGRGMAWASGVDEGDARVPEETAEDALKLVRENGPWVYELFAVLIHSGSALGGHYYAHIKSLGDDEGWFTFNDSRVTPTDEDAVKRAWGGRWGQSSAWQRRGATGNAAAVTGGVGNGSHQAGGATPAAPKWGNSAANAYMLMYRRVDPEQNKRHLSLQEVPAHVVRQVMEEDRKVREAEEAAEAARAALASSIKVCVRLNGGTEKTIQGDKRRPLWEIVDRAAEAFGVRILGPHEDQQEDRRGKEEQFRSEGGSVQAVTLPLRGLENKDCVSEGGDSGGGETDRETQDEGRSDDCTSGGRGEGAGQGAGEGDGRSWNDKDEGLPSPGISSASPDGNVGRGPGVSIPHDAGGETTLSQRPRPPAPRLVRMREYLSGPRLAGSPLEETMTPAELSFSNNEVVWLETRNPGAPWERFDRDDVNVGVVRFVRVGQEHSASGGGGSCGGLGVIRKDSGSKVGSNGFTPPPAPPLPKIPLPVHPILGEFTAARNTRMRASGTVRDIRAEMAGFAGTQEERTRVFTMRDECPEATYRVLCPLPRRCLRRRLPEAGGGGGVDGACAADDVSPKDSSLTGRSVEYPLAPAPPVVGFMTAKAFAGAGAGAAGVDSCTMLSEVYKGGSMASGVKDYDVEESPVVLGPPGSASVHKIFVEEVPEGEEEDKVSPAVRAAVDELNRITLKLVLHGGLEGPDAISADKRWTSDQLRDTIASALGLDGRSFKLRKAQLNNPEIRPGADTLAKQDFFHRLKIHASPGRPLEVDEEAITVASLTVGFRPGLGPPPPSVARALAGGRTPASTSVKPADDNLQSSLLTAQAPGGVGVGGSGIPGHLDGCSRLRPLKFPEMDMGFAGATGARMPNVQASGPAKWEDAGVSCGVVGETSSGDSDEEEEGAGGCAARTPPVCASPRPQARVLAEDVSGPAAGAIPQTQSGSAPATTSPVGGGSGRGVRTDSRESPTPPPASAVWAAAAASAAAATERAASETEVLTRTTVEVAPRDDQWGEEYTVAVKRDSTVSDIRRAVWEELRARGVLPKPTGSAAGEIRGPDAALLGQSPSALRLRERHATIPATILRDSDGKPTRLGYSPYGTPWFLVAQALPADEDLGRVQLSSSHSGGDAGIDHDRGQATAIATMESVEAAAGRHSGPPAGMRDGGRGDFEAGRPVDAKVVVFQWWDRCKWRLTEKYEGWISPTETVADARKRLAEQVGVDPAHLRAHKCTSATRLRLCDLRRPSSDQIGAVGGVNGTAGMGGLGVASVESGGWGSTFSSNNSPSVCRWADLHASRGDQLVGTAAMSEGDLCLLQDVSQPLKKLAPATEASISASDRAPGGGWSSAHRGGASVDDACELASIGPWYEGHSNDAGIASASTSPLMLPANKTSNGYSSKPKERALRIRTRRDRLQEGKVTAAARATAAAAAAAAAATATATAAAASAVAVAVATAQAGAAPKDSGDSGSGDASSRGGGSPGASSDATIVGGAEAEVVSSGEETVGTASGSLVERGCTGGADMSSVAANTTARASGAGTRAASTRSIGEKIPARGKNESPEDGSFRDIWGHEQDVGEAWGAFSSEIRIDPGSAGGHVSDVLMHSEREVAEGGGRAQFDDIAPS